MNVKFIMFDLLINFFFSATICTSDQFQCQDQKCIDKDWHCDSDFDCDDHSDEIECKKNSRPNSCLDTEWACLIEEQCILQEWKCDGELDCFDGTDEINCKLFIVNYYVVHVVSLLSI